MWNYNNLIKECKSLQKLLGNDNKTKLGQYLKGMIDAIISIKKIPDLNIDPDPDLDRDIDNPDIFFNFIQGCFSTNPDKSLESEILAYYTELRMYYEIYYNLKKGKQSTSTIIWPSLLNIDGGGKFN